MVIDLSNSSRKPIIFTAWIFLLLASSIPSIILREIFHQTVSADLQYAMAAIAILAGLVLTFTWNAVRSLRLFFILFLFIHDNRMLAERAFYCSLLR